MSNKTKDAAETKASKPALVPKLRFPEFRDNGAWSRMELTPYLKEYSERVPSTTSIPIYSSTRSGLKPQKDYFDGSNLVNDGEYGVVPAGYFTYRHMSDDGTFKFNVNSTLNSIAVSKEYPVFKAVNISSDFLLYILNNSVDFLKFALMQKKGGTRTRLYLSALRTWDPLLPVVAEQQKIADCLSSIDELITAEAQKVEALKTHKRGLMQLLFPAEGETVPKLRFPEFRNAPEWAGKKLADICQIYKGKGISKADIASEGKTPCIRYGELYTYYGEVIRDVVSRTACQLDDLFLSKANDVIIPASGETKEDIATASCVLSDGVALGGDLNVIRTNHNGVFISYFLNGPLCFKIAKVAQGHTVVHLYPSQLNGLDIKVPDKSEQKRIADCLSSVDDLITAQTQKVEALKAHKKGMMQQLFPVPQAEE